ncbi:MAG: methyltransferase domain-containing protein [Anaerolineae bacterium]|nr:methyltransferase domain-containing protein [Anaerolineae bacterium]
MTLRKRLFAWMYHTLLSRRGMPDFSDALTRNERAPLLKRAQGDVLEIGAGDGVNLALYPAGVRVTLLEPNRYLLRYMGDGTARAPCAVTGAVCGRGERLPFGAGSFDTVVTMHVLCSVHDQEAVLAEIQRVLRPGGQFLFLEHVAASPRSATLRAQRAINPAWSMVGDGCQLTRRTGAAIYAAGFRVVELREFDAPYPAIVRPHISGVARV